MINMPTIRCYLIFLLFFTVDLFDGAFAFTSNLSSLASAGSRVPSGIASRRHFLTLFSKNSPTAGPRTSISDVGSLSSSSLMGISDVFGAIEYNDLLYDDTQTAFDGWEWTANMGAPAALIAAAVLVTFGETRRDTVPLKTDKRWVRFTKRMMRFLLMTSFASEVISIFVGNMLGSMLLGHEAQNIIKKRIGYGAPLTLVHHHHE